MSWRNPDIAPTTPLKAYYKAIRIEEAKLAEAMRTPGLKAERDVVFIKNRIDVLNEIIRKHEGK